MNKKYPNKEQEMSTNISDLNNIHLNKNDDNKSDIFRNSNSIDEVIDNINNTIKNNKNDTINDNSQIINTNKKNIQDKTWLIYIKNLIFINSYFIKNKLITLIIFCFISSLFFNNLIEKIKLYNNMNNSSKILIKGIIYIIINNFLKKNI